MSKYIRQKLVKLQEEIDEFTIVTEDFKTLLSEIDSSSMQKISKDITELKITINQLM